MARYLVACDAGGTMTDVIVVDERGRFVIGKAPTTRYDESVGYMESLEEALGYLRIGEKERPGFFLLESALWSLLFALGSALSGAVQEALGLKAFDLLFGGTLALYALGILLWPWAFRGLERVD